MQLLEAGQSHLDPTVETSLVVSIGELLLKELAKTPRNSRKSIEAYEEKRLVYVNKALHQRRSLNLHARHIRVNLE
jgi:hypothetical protein